MDVTPAEIQFVLEKMARQAPSPVGWQGAVSFLATRYRLDHNRCFCVIERLRRFWTLLGDARLNGWTLARCSSGGATNEAVYRAIAKCTLKANPEHLWFDPEEFCEIMRSETLTDE